MKRSFMLTVLSVLIACPAVVRAGHAKDDAAIQARHQEFCAAWNQHDAQRMAAVFAKDGSLINPFGMTADSRAEIEKLFAGEQSRVMAGTTYSGTIESIRYVDDDMAIMDVAGEITGIKSADGSAAPAFKHHVTWVLEKQHGNWLAVAVRAFVLLPKPMPETGMASPEQTFRELEENWMTAVSQGDVEGQAAFETPDWTIVLPSGEMLTKAQAAEMLKAGDYKLASFKIDELSVQVTGDTAVVKGLETEKSQYKGQDSSGQNRFTDVFVKQDGKWLVSVSQMTGVEKE